MKFLFYFYQIIQITSEHPLDTLPSTGFLNMVRFLSFYLTFLAHKSFIFTVGAPKFNFEITVMQTLYGVDWTVFYASKVARHDLIFRTVLARG